MGIEPAVRLIEEGSGIIIGILPLSMPSLNEGDEIVYGMVGEEPVTYKIEKVRFVCEYTNVTPETGPDRYSVYGRIDLIVSEA